MRRTTPRCRVVLTSSASRATAPERKARRRRRHPVANWKAKGVGGHDDRAAMPGWGRGSGCSSEAIPAEIDGRPPASSRSRVWCQAGVAAGNPGPAGRVLTLVGASEGRSERKLGGDLLSVWCTKRGHSFRHVGACSGRGCTPTGIAGCFLVPKHADGVAAHPAGRYRAR